LFASLYVLFFCDGNLCWLFFATHRVNGCSAFYWQQALALGVYAILGFEGVE
jgi:hypothetical protein